MTWHICHLLEEVQRMLDESLRPARTTLRKLVFTAAALLATTGTSAFAGTVYVPLAGNVTANGQEYSARVWVSNNGTEARTFTSVFISDNRDGTAAKNRTARGTVPVPAQGSAFVHELAPAGSFGILEITGAPQLNVSASLALSGALTGLDIPVISSDNVFPANASVDLLGVLKTPTQATSAILVNTGHTPATCTTQLRTALGAAVGSAQTLTLRPLSQRVVADLATQFGSTGIAGGRFTTTCDKAFFAFGIVLDANGDEELLSPAASAASTLSPPNGNGGGGGGGGGGGNSLACQEGATCFIREGTFYTTTNGEQFRAYKWLVPASEEFRRIEVSYKFRINKWDRDKEGIYTAFYMARRGQWFGNSFALTVVRNKSGRGMFVHEVTAELPKGVIQDWRKSPIDWQLGETYSITYVYNAQDRVSDITLFDQSGQPVAKFSGGLQSPLRRINSEGFFILQFSDAYSPGTHHVPFWATWSDLKVALIE
jgi:hypothetical protein